MRDCYDWDLVCEKCGAKGYAIVSEDADPKDGELNFEVDELSNSFRIQMLGKDANRTVIVCVACDVIV